MTKSQKTLIYQHITGFSGQTTLKDGEVVKTIYFKNGEPLFVKSDLRDETFAHLLLNQKKITLAQHKALIEHALKNSKQMGESAIELGFLAPFEVYESLRDQHRIKFKNAFLLENAEVLVEEGEKHLEGIMNLEIKAYEIIFEFLETKVLLAKTPKFSEKDGLKLNEKGKAYLDRQRLSARESKVVRFLKGQQTFFQILEECNEDPHWVEFYLGTLMGVKFIDSVPLTVKTQTPTVEKKIEVQPQATKPSEPNRTSSSSPKSDLYTWLLRMNLPLHDFFGATAELSNVMMKRNYEKVIRELHLTEIEKFYTGDEVLKAQQLFDLWVYAYQTFTNEKLKKEYFEKIKKHEPVVSDPEKLRAELNAQKAALFAQKKDYDQALKLLEEALALQPNESSYYVSMADIQLKQFAGNVAEKIDPIAKRLNKALELNKTNAHAHYYLGIIKKRQNLFEQARDHFQKCVTIDPKHEMAKAELNLLVRRVGTSDKPKPASNVPFAGLFAKKKPAPKNS